MARSARSPLSLTRRLSLLFAVVSFAVLAALGVYLHHALAQQLALRDTEELIGKVELIRHTLADVASIGVIEQAPERWLDFVVGHRGLHFAIFTEDGRRLLANTELAFAQNALARPASAREARASVIEWSVQGEQHFRSVSAWGVLGRSGGERVLIAFALDLTQERRLLAAYGASIAGAILVGALLASFLGFWASRRGLAPLQMVAQAAGHITASRLDERLDAGAAPKELRILTAAYNAMLDRLQDSFSRLTQFSSDLAHDLRTPIGNLLGEAQVVLARSRTADEYRAVIESSVEELERVSRMIESMLFLARVDNAQLALDPERVRLDVEFAKIRDYFEPLAHDKEVAIELAGAESVLADPTLLRRAISNLVANAIHFAPAGSSPILLVSARTSDGGTEIRVTNQGSEIALKDCERVFDRFYRISDARADSTSGSGLGLAIVRSIMRLHGGSASVECGAGTVTFVLRFPPG